MGYVIPFIIINSESPPTIHTQTKMGPLHQYIITEINTT